MKTLRSGYTTGACAAAAAKAAVQVLLGMQEPPCAGPQHVDIPFPDGSRVNFIVSRSGYDPEEGAAFASVIKDAGDDPDVTNGAEIVARARISGHDREQAVMVRGGKGVGRITKPGLAVAVGEYAINPVPRKMISQAASEAVAEKHAAVSVEITVEIPEGERLAGKTLNSRLGILGGLSVLGTTGIVTPVSAESWKATITSSLDVAKALGREGIVLSAGRTSEKAHMRAYGLPDDCYVMMGDYFEYSVSAAAERGFGRIAICAQWAKMLKLAMATPQTHVRHGAIDIEKAVRFLNGQGAAIPESRTFNTARELFDMISVRSDARYIIDHVREAVRAYAVRIAQSGTRIEVSLVSYDGQIAA